MSNKLEVGKTYMQERGVKCRIIHIEDGLAYGFHLHSDGSHGPTAYAWNMDGVYQNATEEAGREWRIVFEPVREDTRTRLYYSTMYGFKVADDGARADVILEIPFIDGKLDCAQAKVTPCD